MDPLRTLFTRSALALLGAAALASGCAGSSPAPDAGTPRDLAVKRSDFATAADFSLPEGDLATALDFATPTDDLAVVEGDMAASEGDMASSADLSAAAGDLASANDLSGKVNDLTETGDFSTADLGGVCHVLINEVQTGGVDGSDELVELYNPCSVTIDISNWLLVYRAGTNVNLSAGADSSTLGAFPNGTSMKKGTYLAICGQSFTGKCDLAYGEGKMKDGVGAVGLRDPQTDLWDSVAYGTVDPANAFIQTAPAPAPADSASIGRLPNGASTGNNSVDFKVTAKVTPDAANM